MQAEIIVREGARALGRYVLDPGEYIIGSDMSCDILLDSQGVSRKHAQIIVTAERLLVRDLGSTNGTFVGTSELKGSLAVPLQHRIRLGAEGSAEGRLIEKEKAAVTNGNHGSPRNAELETALAFAKAESHGERKKQEELCALLAAAAEEIDALKSQIERDGETSARVAQDAETRAKEIEFLRKEHGHLVQQNEQ